MLNLRLRSADVVVPRINSFESATPPGSPKVLPTSVICPPRRAEGLLVDLADPLRLPLYCRGRVVGGFFGVHGFLGALQPS